MAIRIITDSPSDISIKDGDKLNINIVPLKINIEGKSYREGIDISVEEFYEKLETSKVLPTTSTPSPEDFLTYFKDAKEAGDDVIVIALASVLSGTYQFANLAKDMAEYPNIYIIDSEQATLSQMLLVKYAIKLRDEGKTALEILDVIEKAKKKVRLLAVVDTLEYLHKGGRLSKGVAVAGGILNIKPIITLDNGSVSLISKSRGMKGAIKNMLNLMDEYGPIDFTMPVIYGYAGTSSGCENFKEMANEKYSFNDTQMHPIGSVIGTHAGPGAFGVAFLQE